MQMTKHRLPMAPPGTPDGVRPARGVSQRPLCPVCGGSTQRIPRRWMDRLTSLVVPMRRYRCHSVGCAWEGNLRGGMRSSDAERRRYERRIDAP